MLGEPSHRVWGLEWEERGHHPCKAGKCSFGGKQLSSVRQWDPALAVVYSDAGRGLDQMVQKGPAKVFFPLPFGKGIAFVLSFDWC